MKSGGGPEKKNTLYVNSDISDRAVMMSVMITWVWRASSNVTSSKLSTKSATLIRLDFVIHNSSTTLGLLPSSSHFLMTVATVGWTTREISGMSMFCWRCSITISGWRVFFSMLVAILSPSLSSFLLRSSLARLSEGRLFSLHKHLVHPHWAFR